MREIVKISRSPSEYAGERKEKMNSDTPATVRGSNFRKDLDREAVALAMRGEWERAAEVNRAILELFADDVEAMNRLVKALMELGSFDEAHYVVDRVCEIAPNNNIARKNRARLDQMRGKPAATTRHARGAAGAPQLFIGESGKSATTTLLHTRPANLSRAAVSHRVIRSNWSLSTTRSAFTARTASSLGQVDPRLGHRLSRLIEGGNTYVAAIIGAHEDGIIIMIHETSRHRSLQKVTSFPTRVAQLSPRARTIRDGDTVNRVIGDDESVADGDDEGVIDEDELQAAWSENE